MADPELDERVREIVGLMLAGEWVAGASHIALAKKCKVEQVTVRRWASEAGRFIRLCHGAEDEIRDELLRSIRRVGRKAEDAEDYRSANQSLELAAKVHGLLEQKQRSADERVEVPLTEAAELLRAAGATVELPKDSDAASNDGERKAKEGGGRKA